MAERASLSAWVWSLQQKYDVVGRLASDDELAAAAEREREREARAHPCPRPTLVRRHTHHCLTQSPPSARQAALRAH